MSSRKRPYTPAPVPLVAWEVGVLVWAKWGTKWWSAIIIQKIPNEDSATIKNYLVFWWGDHRISKVSSSNICDFKDHFHHISKLKGNSKTWLIGVKEALRELYKVRNADRDEELLEWANDNFRDCPVRENNLPNWVEALTNKIKKMKKSGEIKEQKKMCPYTVKSLFRVAALEKVSVTNICLSCYREGPAEEHPFFIGAICKECEVNIREAQYRIGNDGKKLLCTICSRKEELVHCCVQDCQRAYCSKCLDLLAAPEAKSSILLIDNWSCFLCTNYNKEINGSLHCREDYETKIKKLLHKNTLPLVPMLSPTLLKQPLRVLSLFDGIAAGLVALKKQNIPVEVYYASEIDTAAINIVKFNHKDIVEQIGDILKIDEKLIKNISPIHLLIGGSPCNDLSRVNPNRKGLTDETGTGKLFFEYYRVLQLVKKFNPGGFFWLFENVAGMSNDSRSSISRYLQCNPQVINSVNFSPQRRARLYWGNLPTLEQAALHHTETHLQAYLMLDRRAMVDTIRTVTTNKNSLRQNTEDGFAVSDANGMPDNLWLTELELLFGFPRHYTDTGNLTLGERQAALGKSWTIPLIEFLFKFLSNEVNEANEENSNLLPATLPKKTRSKLHHSVRPSMPSNKICESCCTATGFTNFI